MVVIFIFIGAAITPADAEIKTMPWFEVIDTQTGSKHNALASDIAGAKRSQAMVAAGGLAGRRGRPIAGTRYAVEGETFDVEFYMEALQGAQPSRTERRKADAATRALTSRHEQFDNREAASLMDGRGLGWADRFAKR